MQYPKHDQCNEDVAHLINKHLTLGCDFIKNHSYHLCIKVIRCGITHFQYQKYSPNKIKCSNNCFRNF